MGKPIKNLEKSTNKGGDDTKSISTSTRRQEVYEVRAISKNQKKEENTIFSQSKTNKTKIILKPSLKCLLKKKSKKQRVKLELEKLSGISFNNKLVIKKQYRNGKLKHLKIKKKKGDQSKKYQKLIRKDLQFKNDSQDYEQSNSLKITKQLLKRNEANQIKLLKSKICQVCEQRKKNQNNQKLICYLCSDAYHNSCLSKPVTLKYLIGKSQWYCKHCKKVILKKQNEKSQVIKKYNRQYISDDEFPTQRYDLYCKFMKSRAKQMNMLQLTDLQSSECTRRQRQHFKLIPFKPIKQKKRYWIPLIKALSSTNHLYSQSQLYHNENILQLNKSKNNISSVVQRLNIHDERAFEKFLQLVENGEAPPLTLQKCQHKGYMIKSLGFIPKKTILCQYGGQVLTLRQSLKITSDSIFRLLQTGRSKYSLDIAPIKFGNISKYYLGINNTKIQNYQKVNVQSLMFCYKGRNRIIFYTLRHIKPGHLLFINYNGGVSGKYQTQTFV